MRIPLLAAVAAGLLAAAGPARGQSPTYPAETVITAPEANVHCGPTDQFYVTSKLRQGDRVLVLAEVKNQPGWLAIMPPRGSFSWVNGKHVKMPISQFGFVEPTDGSAVTFRPGSSIVNQEPDVNSLQLKAGSTAPLEIVAGTIVEVIDKALSLGDQTWLPVKPHPSEVRFIRADVVKPPVALAGNGAPNWTLKNEMFTTNPRLADADQAARAGNLERARQLYKEAADLAVDQNQKAFALNRWASLNQGTAPPGYPGNVTAWQGAGNTQTTSFSKSNPPAAGSPLQ